MPRDFKLATAEIEPGSVAFDTLEKRTYEPRMGGLQRKRVRVGILGAGAVAESYHLPVLGQMPGVELAWVSDKSLDRARAIARTYRIEAAHANLEHCAPVDAVLVAIPVGARRAALTHIAARGWHAFCEKPFASTYEEHLELVDIARRQRIRLGIGLVRRHYASTAIARRLVAENSLGAVKQIVAGDGIWMRRTGRGADFYQADPAASGGGVFAETGSHLVDQMLTIVGAKGYDLHQVHQHVVEGLELETTVDGKLDLGGSDRGVPFVCVVSRARDLVSGISIRCELGEIRVGLGPDAVVETFARNGVSLGKVGPTLDARRAIFDAVRAEWEAFLDATHSGSEFTDWDTGLLTTRFIEDCYQRSARTTGHRPAKAPTSLEGRAE